jgi:hypothetical protein
VDELSSEKRGGEEVRKDDREIERSMIEVTGGRRIEDGGVRGTDEKRGIVNKGSGTSVPTKRITRESRGEKTKKNKKGMEMSTHKRPNKVPWRVSKVEGIGRGWSFIAHPTRGGKKPGPLAPSEQVIETRIKQRKCGGMEIRRKMREQSGG